MKDDKIKGPASKPADQVTISPDQVTAITEKVLAEVADMTVSQFRKRFPTLFGLICRSVGGPESVNLNAPGFLLDVEDPFAEGALRVYSKISGKSMLRLPIVLPYKGEATREAITSYILRAEGGGDNERAVAARQALAKVK